ncbi:neuroendocrine convertase 1 [Octopus sinensis]|uniref:Neuroendocrine convertase 1 n=1 Tax=Octopus sinensis TaxID=2607531 RepID=A0A6P7U7N6_9MOLL|nr:neuroendocrine convertase 1 [Octopus sinensis]
MDGLKLFTKSEAEMDSLVRSVQIFSNDIKIEFGLSKCVTMGMRRGKLVRTEGVVLPSGEIKILWFEQQQIRKRAKRSSEVLQLYRKDAFSDTLWSEEWYLRNPRSLKDADLLVLPCWAQNITGNGIVVTVLDDGIEWMHDDLRKNYDPKASVDLNDNDEDPRPRYDPSNENKHGTRCAGEIAMTANNNICGVGIAFNSKIGGVRMLDGPITDSLEARALGFNHKYIDIYSASWGPLDNGMTLDGPGTLSRKAMELSIKEGRDGKGVLYVWASGNGGNRDNCNCDGYASSIYTISISSITSTMMKPWYVEYCASTMASTFSGGLTLSEGKVVRYLCIILNTENTVSSYLCSWSSKPTNCFDL